MNKDKKEKIDKIINKIITPTASITDPLGMYTGVPQNKSDVPEQDADDL